MAIFLFLIKLVSEMNNYDIAEQVRRLLLDLPESNPIAGSVNSGARSLRLQTTPAKRTECPKIIATLRYKLWGSPQQTTLPHWSNPEWLHTTIKQYDVALEQGYELGETDISLLTVLCNAYSVPIIMKAQAKKVIASLDGLNPVTNLTRFGAEILRIQNNECRRFRPAGETVHFCPKRTHHKRLVERALLNLSTFREFYATMANALNRQGLGDYLD